MPAAQENVRRTVSLPLEEGIRNVDLGIAKILLAVVSAGREVFQQLPFRVGLTESLNPFGEKQAELDVYANEIFSKALAETGVVGWVASEEMSKPLVTPTAGPDSFSVTMDPLDGSSNITTNNPVGSIFGVWRGELPQRGRDQVASAFLTYGPTLSITFTTGSGVEQYVEIRDGPDAGKFVLAYKSMKLPDKPEVYGFGGTRSTWIPAVSRFVETLEGRGMHLRYGGTFIGDYNQVIRRGGIFSYPALKDKPRGKLRVAYETAPVSLITRAAGGASSDGRGEILEIEPNSLKDTSPFYTGNMELIAELEREIGKG